MRLVIDCATPACSVALIEGTRILAEYHEIVGRGHAERLIGVIEALLDGRTPNAILVDTGPGSFTGVRVGLAAAQGLAMGWRVPLSGYSSLALIAAGTGEAEVAVALEAGHGEIFVQQFGGRPLAETDQLRSLLPAQAAGLISTATVFGSGAEALINARGHGQAIPAFPRAADARLLSEASCSLPPRPVYGRAPDARPMA